jgi:hypothetical protein
MANIHKLAEQMIEAGQRMADMADAAEGKRAKRTSGLSGWVLLPAAGAGLYALVRSDFFTRQAKSAVDGAKSLASDLPDELMESVRQTTRTSPSRRPTSQNPSSRRQRSQNSSNRTQASRKSTSRSGSQRRRKTSSAR